MNEKLFWRGGAIISLSLSRVISKLREKIVDFEPFFLVQYVSWRACISRTRPQWMKNYVEGVGGELLSPSLPVVPFRSYGRKLLILNHFFSTMRILTRVYFANATSPAFNSSTKNVLNFMRNIFCLYEFCRKSYCFEVIRENADFEGSVNLNCWHFVCRAVFFLIHWLEVFPGTPSSRKKCTGWSAREANFYYGGSPTKCLV